MLRDGLDEQGRLCAWLALLQAGALAPHDLFGVLESCGSPGAVIRAVAAGVINRSHLPAPVLDALRRPQQQEIDAHIEWLQHTDHHLVTLDSGHYPALLRQAPSPPPGLFVRGDPKVLSGLQVAVVGSRKPTVDGRKDAVYFAAELAERGITVTSGMAHGIDTEAHRGALSRQGKTVAVIGSGLHHIYPRANIGLADSICEQGALASEFPLSCRPFAANFPRRNRIISGLSAGVLVIEAAARSGSLITARHALEQNREVFAVPGSIRNPMKRGCHRLLRDGAGLVECVEDIFAGIASFKDLCPPAAAPAPAENAVGLDEREKVLLDNIGYEPTSLDEIANRMKTGTEDLAATLLNLELGGLITAVSPGNYVRANRPHANNKT